MTASGRLLYGEKSRMHCSGVILAHSSRVFKSWSFHGLLLWTLIFSSYFLLDSSQVIGWAILAALFSFSEINSFLGCVFRIIVLLKCPSLFYPHHPGTVGVGTEPANINFHWQGAGLLSNYWLAFYAFLHLPFFMCSILFFPVSIHFITQLNFCTYLFFVCMYVFVCYRHLVKISCQQTFRNIFTEKNVDLFNTYFTRCVLCFWEWNVKQHQSFK